LVFGRRFVAPAPPILVVVPPAPPATLVVPPAPATPPCSLAASPVAPGSPELLEHPDTPKVTITAQANQTLGVDKDEASLALLIEILPSPSLLRALSAFSLLSQIRRVSSLVARRGQGSSRRAGSVRISISSAREGSLRPRSGPGAPTGWVRRTRQTQRK